MRLLAQQNLPRPSPETHTQSLRLETAAFGFGYALEYHPLSVPVRSEDPCTGLEPGASSPSANLATQERNETAAKQTRPPVVRGESPRFL